MKTPSGWTVAPIRTLGKVTGGRQLSPHLTKGRLRPYLRVANILDGYIDCTDVKAMLFRDNEFERYRLHPGDVLLNEGQSLDLVGRSAIYEGLPPDCAFQNTVVRFRPLPIIDPTFALLLFQHMQARGRFAAIASRTTSIAHLGVERFAALQVCLPPLKERQRITALLSAQTRIQQVASKLLDAKRYFKRGVMQQLLTPHRRVGFQSEWKQYRLGDLFTERVETNRPDLPLLSITADRGVVPRNQLDRRDSSNPDKRLYLRIVPGDVGYNTMRMWQGVNAKASIEGIVSPAYTVCIPNELIDADFAAALFKYPPIVHLFQRYSQGLVDDTLSLKFHNFAQIYVRIPVIEEQRVIARAFRSVDQELQRLQKLVEAYDRQKRTLLDKLLSGELRLPAS